LFQWFLFPASTLLLPFSKLVKAILDPNVGDECAVHILQTRRTELKTRKGRLRPQLNLPRRRDAQSSHLQLDVFEARDELPSLTYCRLIWLGNRIGVSHDGAEV